MVCATKWYALSPTIPDEKTFEELSKLVQGHQYPEPSKVIQY